MAGAENEAAFLQTLRDHISNFVDYANGAVIDGEEAIKAAIRGLDAAAVPQVDSSKRFLRGNPQMRGCF